MIFKSLLRIFSILFFCRVLIAIPADVEDLSDRAYFPALLKEIQTAQKSIHACLYYISYSQKKESKVHQLLDALIDAKTRGVDVQILLDRSAGAIDTSGKNVQAFSYLKRNGIPVFYDNLKTLTHAKYWIIDGETVIVGSFNLSETALSLSHEAAVAIHSSELARRYQERFGTLPRTDLEAVQDAIPIPGNFLRDRNRASRIVAMNSNLLLDANLLLFKESLEQKSADVILSEAKIIEHYYRGKNINFLRMEPLTYFVKQFVQRNKKGLPPYEYDWKIKKLVFHLETPNETKDDSLHLSKLYWEDRWFERLSENAQFSLLYMLDRTESGRMGEYFEEGRWDAVKDYKVDHAVFAYGLGELQRWNLIEKYIRFRPREKNVNGYTLNPFYRLEDFEKSLAALREKTEPEVFKWTQDIADTVNEPHDLEVLKTLIDLGKRYGAPVLKRIADKIRNKAPISPQRRYSYVRVMIENEGEGKSAPVPEPQEETPNED